MRNANADSAESMLASWTGELEEAVVTCVWTQWMLLGGTAAARRPETPVPPIDPEALLLASLGLFDTEPRLADVLRGWLRANAALVSVQRFRNLASQYAPLVTAAGRQRVGWLAQVARTEAKDARWLALARSAASADVGSTARASRSRTKSPPPSLRPIEPHHQMLRLRLGLGIGIKADVLAFLLGQDTSRHTIRDIAGALTYTVAPVRRALEDLADAAFISRREGHPVRYGATPARWQALLGTANGETRWGRWDERFRFAVDWLAWARAPRTAPLTPYVLSVRARDVMARHREAFGGRELPSERAGVETSSALDAIAGELRAFSQALLSIGRTEANSVGAK